MTFGPSLVQLLGVDVETVQILAETAEGAGRLAANQTPQSGQVLDVSERWYPSVRPGPRLHLSALSPDARPYLRAATLLTMAASNWLVLGDVDRAKLCFGDAAGQVARLNADDAFVLRLCSDPSVRDWLSDAPSGGLSPWAQALGQALALAQGQPAGHIHEWVGVAASSMPLCGLHAWDFENVARLIADASDDDASDDIGPSDQNEELADREALVDEMVDLLLVRAAAPIEPVMETAWWRLQTGSILPLEPELVAVALIGAAWHGREGRPSVLELSPLAQAAFIAASQLLG
jgi:hypothetical protein